MLRRVYTVHVYVKESVHCTYMYNICLGECTLYTVHVYVKESVRVYVEPDWGDCKPGFYNCNNTNNYCIPKR